MERAAVHKDFASLGIYKQKSFGTPVSLGKRQQRHGFEEGVATTPQAVARANMALTRGCSSTTCLFAHSFTFHILKTLLGLMGNGKMRDVGMIISLSQYHSSPQARWRLSTFQQTAPSGLAKNSSYPSTQSSAHHLTLRRLSTWRQFDC